MADNALSSFLGGFAGGTLGAVVVDVSLNTTGLQQGLKQAHDRVESEGTAVARLFGGIPILVAAAASSLISFAVQAVKAEEEHQAALQKLASVAGVNAEAFAKLAEEQVSLTGFRENDIISAETYLSVLHLNTDQMSQLLVATEDYARFSGKDLPDAAKVTERAFSGGGRLLHQLGINYKVTGDHAKDFAVILKGIQGAVGGTAADYLKTTAGQLEKLNAEFDLAKEHLGVGLTPVFLTFVNILISLLPLIKVLGYVILAVVGVIELAVAAVQDFQAAMKDLGHTVLDFIGISHGNGEAIDHLGKSYRQTNDLIGQYLHGMDSAIAGTKQFTGQTDLSGAALQKQQQAAQAAKLALQQLAGGEVAILAARSQRLTAEQNLAKVEADKKSTTQQIHDAEVSLLQAQLGLNSAILDYKNNLRTSSQDSEYAIRQLKKLETQAGLTGTQVAWMNTQLANIGTSINVGTSGTGRMTDQQIAAQLGRILRGSTA